MDHGPRSVNDRNSELRLVVTSSMGAFRWLSYKDYPASPTRRSTNPVGDKKMH